MSAALFEDMPFSQSPSYYQPLPLEHGNIRLLRLLPSENEGAPIYCQMITYSLKKSSKRAHLYDALSYAWGGEEKARTVCVDGCQVPITTSLHDALLQLRNHSFERLIWADAICICQEDTPEKEAQILMMASIYSLASRVIVWLGDASRDSDLAIDTIRTAGYRRDSLVARENNAYSAICTLLLRPWFRRVWVCAILGSQLVPS
jgi:hypothetical protein